MPTPHLTFYNRFFDALNQLPESLRPAVYDALEALRDGRPTPPVQPVGAGGLWWFAVPGTPLHIVCHREGNLLVMLTVAPLAEARSWADQNRVLRSGNALRVIPTAESAAPQGPVHNAPWGTSRRLSGPLARHRRRHFARFGIGPAAAQVLRQLRTEDEVMELAELMLPAYADLLLGLATDEPLADLVARFEQTEGPPPRDPTPVVQAASNSAHLFTPSTAQDLAAALAGPPEAWAVFPHPQQQRAIQARTAGAAKVVGGPGTGKTVVAVHRARQLARETFADAGRPVLLTVFSPLLVLPLQQMLDHLCAHEPEVRDRIEVLDLVAVAQRVLAHARRHHRRASHEVVERCWDHAVAQVPELRWTKGQLRVERAHVLGRNGAWTWEAYCDTPRQGRSVRLTAKQRVPVWDALHAFEEALADAGVGDGLALVRAAEQVVREETVRSPYIAVVCDEVQDASAAELRMLAALARDPDVRAIRPDGLMLVGDGYQRVYARPVPLVQCGIEVRGRSWTLRVNYRSTESIREAALREVAELDPDVLDAGTEDSKDGYRSERDGETPERHTFPSHAAEAAWIAERSAEGPLLVLTRHHGYRDELAHALTAHGAAVRVLHGEGMPDQGLTIATIHRSKGLEAPRVVLAGAQELHAAFRGEGEPERAWWVRQEHCLAYVGMTRARDWLAITSVADGAQAR